MNIGFVLIPYQHYSGVGEYYRNLFKHLIDVDKENIYTIFLPSDAGEDAYQFFGRERLLPYLYSFLTESYSLPEDYFSRRND
ncbi:MAG: hypothetical protein L7F78_23905 [Syntrophales bacterium LBB04]|nr:hypothetical protein [Syntrophales bacterium LBB04]